MFQKLILVIGICFLESQTLAEQQSESWNEACFEVSSKLAEGDLIFLDIPNVLFRKVAAATDSWTSHVGIAFKDKRGSWVVAESTVPLSKLTPLCEYLKRSVTYRFEVRRLKQPLIQEEIKILKSSALRKMNKIYDLGFNFDSQRYFCSKFVYLTYFTIGVEVGQLESFQELLFKNPQASLRFWKYWFFGRIPWDRRTVTPASQLNDPKFFTVLSGIN